MKSNKPIAEIRAEEQLRQERETFEQHKWMAERQFLARQRMVGASFLILPAILAVAIWVFTHPERYPSLTIPAGAAVFGTILCAMVFIWKTIVRPESNKPVHPITLDQAIARQSTIMLHEKLDQGGRDDSSIVPKQRRRGDPV
jgi:hypothetical protein